MYSATHTAAKVDTTMGVCNEVPPCSGFIFVGGLEVCAVDISPAVVDAPWVL